MIVPIRCFTCGKVIADKYDYYLEEVQKLQKKLEQPNIKVKTKKDAEADKTKEHELRHFEPLRTGAILDKLDIKKMCCRRMMLGTEDMMDTI